MAISRSISLPEEIVRQAEEWATRQHISVEEFVSAALLEQFASSEYLRRRGERATSSKFREALAQIPDAEPEPNDRLQ